MAKKTKSFAEKVAAASQETGKRCPECGETYQNVQQVTSVQKSHSKDWRFNQKMVAVCKCNRSEVMG
ncbi:MAG TPA: hypothetical protein VKA68_01630 [bacterium]|nr:hypothetical protein [bacterium]